MPVSSATSSPSIAALTANPGNAAAARVTKRTLGQEDFLKLITVQLSSQDPLKPMDSTEFTTQLVQFTGVEQQINANKSLDAILAQGKSNQALQELDHAQLRLF